MKDHRLCKLSSTTTKECSSLEDTDALIQLEDYSDLQLYLLLSYYSSLEPPSPLSKPDYTTLGVHEQTHAAHKLTLKASGLTILEQLRKK